MIKIKKNELMSRYTTFHIGGRARYFVSPKNISELLEALNFARRKRQKIYIIGAGSNILVSDNGLKGLTINPQMQEIKICGRQVIADSGVRLSRLLNVLAEKGLAGLEELAGIPGTAGGACAMNAGQGGSSISSAVQSVWAADLKGKIKMFPAGNCAFAYRKSIFLKGKYIIVKVVFRLKKGKPAAIRKKINEIIKIRLAKHPYNAYSAGSFFKNPKPLVAARLIDEAGCKGMKVGGAKVSEKHANFIINLGKARVADVKKLAGKVIAKVKKTSGITLVPEVKFLE